MNTTRASAVELARAVSQGSERAIDAVDVLIAPPFPYLIPVVEAVKGTGVAVGAQNAYFEQPGAFTGEVALEMLVDVGCSSVILGHSERRHVLGETDEVINRKVRAALDHDLQVILCVGELLSEREAGQTNSILDAQMSAGLKDVAAEAFPNLVIAYEPVWAIGTGKTATPEQAEQAHAHLRNWLTGHYNGEVGAATRILYGGSVKPDNAHSLLAQPNVDGALVGGASLSAKNFVPIIEAAART